MKVVLPRECTGEEVLEAFKKAAAFELSPTERWVAEVEEKEIRYEPGSVKRVVEVAEATAVREAFVKEWILSKRRWFKTDQNFYLPEIGCQKRYTTVEMRHSSCRRETFEAFLARFYEELTPKAA